MRHRPPVNRTRRFADLVRYYRLLHEELEREGSGPYRLTRLGAWASSRAPHVYRFFRSLGLENYRLFMDLGSGDGIVACIAGLFTRAIGVEVDPDLCRTAMRAARVLNLEENVSFICADYRTQRIERADCLYMYPDKPPSDLEHRLRTWQGALLVYGPHFPIKGFYPVRRLDCGKERMVVYTSLPVP